VQADHVVANELEHKLLDKQPLEFCQSKSWDLLRHGKYCSQHQQSGCITPCTPLCNGKFRDAGNSLHMQYICRFVYWFAKKEMENVWRFSATLWVCELDTRGLQNKMAFSQEVRLLACSCETISAWRKK